MYGLLGTRGAGTDRKEVLDQREKTRSVETDAPEADQVEEKVYK